MTLEEKAEEYVESRGIELFREFYYKQLPITDLLKKCCVEFVKEIKETMQDDLVAKCKQKYVVSKDGGNTAVACHSVYCCEQCEKYKE